MCSVAGMGVAGGWGGEDGVASDGIVPRRRFQRGRNGRETNSLNFKKCDFLRCSFEFSGDLSLIVLQLCKLTRRQPIAVLANYVSGGHYWRITFKMQNGRLTH